jgi:4-hydroxy-2-oxoheptanedioate aldolase
VRDLSATLRSGEPLYGVFVLSGSPVAVELIGRAGFDFVAIDCQHGVTSSDGEDLADLIRAAEAADVAPVARVAGHHPGMILKPLDLGAAAVIVPNVNTAEQARAAVEAARYPPHGRRSAYPSARAAGYGTETWEGFEARQNRAALVFALIEEAEGLENVEEIAAVEGLGGLYFGPFDLALSLGDATMAFDLEAHARNRQRVYEAARRHGLPIGDLAWDAASAGVLRDQGATMIGVGFDVSVLFERLRRMREELGGA